MTIQNAEDLMTVALRAAAASSGTDVPVGAIVSLPGQDTIYIGHNTREVSGDIVGHAEINAMRAASADVGTWKLHGATLVTTLEPCPMCAHSIAESGISRVIFGAYDLRMGAAGSVLDLLRGWPSRRNIEVLGGVKEQECAALLQDFFLTRRGG